MALSGSEAFEFDLSTALIADSGSRIMLDGGDTWISCSIATKLSKSGIRFVRFTVQNYARRGVICVPAAGDGLRLRSIGHRAVPVERSEHREFEVRFPARVQTIALFVQSATEQCVFILPAARPVVSVETGLALLAVAAICGAAGALAYYALPPRRKRSGTATQPHAAEAQADAPVRTPDPPAESPPQPEPEPVSEAEAAPTGDGPLPAETVDLPPVEVVQTAVRYAEAAIEEPGTTLAFSGTNGAVVGAIEMLERKLRSALFVLKVVNETPDPLMCTWQGVRGTSASALTPSSFRIEPMAASAVTLAVPLRLFSPFERAFVNLRSRTMSCTLETKVPESRLYPAIKTLLACAVLLLVLAVAYSTARPRIVAYALPASVVAGSMVRADYSLGGSGRGSYDVSTRSGRVASGTISPGEGYFSFATEALPETYAVTLRFGGPLGAQTETRPLRTVGNVVSAGRNAEALIGTFEVENATVRSGQPIVARYAGPATGGSIRLLDAAQIVVAQAPYSSDGTTSIVAPQVQLPTPYRLELSARKGSAAQAISVGILVEPASAPPSKANGGAGRLISAKDLLRIEPSYVRGGSLVRIALLQRLNGLALSIQDARGAPADWVQVSRDAGSVSYSVPLVRSDQRFVIVASFKEGSGNQLVLAPFLVHAR